MKFFIEESADLVTFTEEILNKKLHFLCSVSLFSLRLLTHFLKNWKQRIKVTYANKFRLTFGDINIEVINIANFTIKSSTNVKLPGVIYENADIFSLS